MKREKVLKKSFSMILLTALLSVSIISCGSPVSSSTDTQETATQQKTQGQDGSAETKESELKITVNGLDFNSTQEDVVKKLGTSDHIDSAPGVSIYYYGDYENKPFACNTISFIGDTLYSFGIGNNDLTIPEGVKIGDTAEKAVRAFYIPESLAKIGVKADDTDAEILQKIIDSKRWNIYFSDYKNSRLDVGYNLSSGVISRITFTRGKDSDRPIQIEPSDFTASAEDIVDKFGYPDRLEFDTEYAFAFCYNASKISFFIDSSIVNNSFRISDNWVAPYDLKINDKIIDVFHQLYIPDEIKSYGVTASMTNDEIAKVLINHHRYNIHFNSHSDYDITISYNEEGIVEDLYIDKFEHPQYAITRLGRVFDIPAFDKDTIATKADLYLSGCKLGSSMKEVFQLLGAPKKTEVGYHEYVDKYQDCYFDSSEVDFMYVDFEDLASGQANYYSIADPNVVGPRGVCVGDPIGKVLEVFPGRDDIDFKTVTAETAIYINPENPDDITNTATVYPSDDETNAGAVCINVDYTIGMTFEYENGIITRMILSKMLD